MSFADEYVTVGVDRLDCAYEPRVWPFAEERDAEIRAHWARLTAANPKLYNGRVLLQHRSAIMQEGHVAVFRGAYLEASYMAFLAWRDFGHPGAEVRNCFSLAALRSDDGAFIVGEMAPHTASPGRVYFPAGTPDPGDVRDGKVDLAESAVRELAEETGIEAGEVTLDAGWTLMMNAFRVACIRVARSPARAADLAERIGAFLADQAEPELARVHIIRRAADCNGFDMPGFMPGFFRQAFGED
jgi:8-oxo-dGTP pyrophosphatase MutT (NUDIX family)